MLSIVNAVQSPLHICPNAKGNPVIFNVTVSPDPLIPGQVAIYHIYGTLREELTDCYYTSVLFSAGSWSSHQKSATCYDNKITYYIYSTISQVVNYLNFLFNFSLEPKKHQKTLLNLSIIL